MRAIKEFENLPETIALQDELYTLNEKFHSEQTVPIVGTLDMILWNTICLDKEEELYKIMKLTFAICKEFKY